MCWLLTCAACICACYWGFFHTDYGSLSVLHILLKLTKLCNHTHTHSVQERMLLQQRCTSLKPSLDWKQSRGDGEKMTVNMSWCFLSLRTLQSWTCRCLSGERLCTWMRLCVCVCVVWLLLLCGVLWWCVVVGVVGGGGGGGGSSLKRPRQPSALNHPRSARQHQQRKHITRVASPHLLLLSSLYYI